jgi:predicted ATPase/DNA-binding SARP family transcriptional activator
VDTHWRIELFGGLRVLQGERAMTHFRTQKTAGLLAYLAFYRERKHSRDALSELFWSESRYDAARNSVSKAISSLRNQLEPPGVPRGAVIIADRHSVQLNPAVVTTDVAEFEDAIRRSNDFSRYSDAERAQFLITAADLYRGELLPNFFDEWIETERRRLVNAYLRALRSLIKYLGQARELERALDYALRAVSADPLDERSHRTVIRLLVALGRPAAAAQQFQDLERLLREQLDAAPSAATLNLVREIAEGGMRQRRETAEDGRKRQGTVGNDRKRQETAGNDGKRQGTAGRLGGVASPSSPDVSRRSPSLPDVSSPSPPAGSLPFQFTCFFGREEEIAKLQKMLRAPKTRLVTLTGLGGCGKTRLAVEVGERIKDEFSGGVWFVPLASLVLPRLIVGTIRDVLRLPRLPGVEPLEQVVEALLEQKRHGVASERHGVRSLLILDNFEHLAAEGAPALVTLLKRVPSLKCLVTSRRRLELSGEREFPVLPLPLPEHPNTRTLEYLMSCPSVQLFVDRAQAMRPDFQVTAGNAAAVAEMCQRLEGIPLALELAAARARALTPGQMLARFSQRFALLTKRRDDVADRHRSLWAAMAWSYDLLPPELQRFFARLSVFRGGWSLEAAAVLSADFGSGLNGFTPQTPQPNPLNPLPKSVDRALEYLAQLRSHSLVTIEEGAPEIRYGLLETVREFAAEQLSSQEQSALSQKHAHYFLSLAEQANAALTGAPQTEWLNRLEIEHDNLRAALMWAIGESANQRIGESVISQFPNFPIYQFTPSEIALRLAGALYRFWGLHGHLSEGREWLRQALELTEGSGFRVQGSDIAQPPTLNPQPLTLMVARAKALLAAGVLAWAQSDFGVACPLFEESLSVSRALDDKRNVAWSLHYLGRVAWYQGDYAAARSLLEESLSISRESGDKTIVAWSLFFLGSICWLSGDHLAARAQLEESLTTFSEFGDTVGMAVSRGAAAYAAWRQGDSDSKTARAIMEEATVIVRSSGHKLAIGFFLNLLGIVDWIQGDYAAARASLEASLTMAQAIRNQWGIQEALIFLGNVVCEQGDTAQAHTLIKEGLTIARALELKVNVAFSLEAFGLLALAQGQFERAARLFGAAETFRESISLPLPPVIHAHYERRLTAARGDAAFNAAFSQGRALTVEQAVAYALDEAAA